MSDGGKKKSFIFGAILQKKILGFSFPLKSIQAQQKWVKLYPFTYESALIKACVLFLIFHQKKALQRL